MNQIEQWKHDGYLVHRNVFEAEWIENLREACDGPLAQWQRESIAEGEPGGYCYGPNAWVMLHLNHPKYHQHHPQRLATLLNAVADPRVLAILNDIFREPAIFSQINYYIDPLQSRPAASWHRDSQFHSEFTGEDETSSIHREADPPREIHMHIPLVPTAATEVVPGSHLRTDTPEEGRIRRDAPDSDEMANTLRLHLEPGDLGFFHVNALHRGLYLQGIPRRTIAVTLNRASDPRPITAAMMEKRKGYFPAYQPWFSNPKYLDGCSPAAREFYQRFIDVYGENWRPDLMQKLPQSLQEYFTKY